MYKYEKLEIWRLSIDYLDMIYDLIDTLPREEECNLATQLRRAATSVALNIAEGSTGQTNAEQARFLGHASRSLIETLACLRIGERRGYFKDDGLLKNLHRKGELLAKKPWLRENETPYVVSEI